jgi:hypothetical protein
MKNIKREIDNIEILCEAYNKASKENLLKKQEGEKIVIIGEVSTNDSVSGYTVDIKKVK